MSNESDIQWLDKKLSVSGEPLLREACMNVLYWAYLWSDDTRWVKIKEVRRMRRSAEILREQLARAKREGG